MNESKKCHIVSNVYCFDSDICPCNIGFHRREDGPVKLDYDKQSVTVSAASVWAKKLKEKAKK